MKPFYLALCMIFILSLQSHALMAQVLEDTVIVSEPAGKDKKGSIFSGRPGKSMLMSLIIPGSGQIYNKSYLRVPFVYAAVGGAGAYLFSRSRQYKCYKEAYIAAVDGEVYMPHSYCPEGLENVTDLRRLKLLRDNANSYRQQSIIIFSLVWLANGVDAFVDAHLKDFDIDENLSFDIKTKFDDPNAPMRIGLFVQF